MKKERFFFRIKRINHKTILQAKIFMLLWKNSRDNINQKIQTEKILANFRWLFRKKTTINHFLYLNIISSTVRFQWTREGMNMDLPMHPFKETDYTRYHSLTMKIIIISNKILILKTVKIPKKKISYRCCIIHL